MNRLRALDVLREGGRMTVTQIMEAGGESPTSSHRGQTYRSMVALEEAGCARRAGRTVVHGEIIWEAVE